MCWWLDQLGDLPPAKIVNVDDPGARQEEDCDDVTDLLLADHLAHLAVGVPLRVRLLVPLLVRLRRGLRLDVDNEGEEALGPSPSCDLVADVVREPRGGEGGGDLHLADLLPELLQNLPDHLLWRCHADVAGGQLHAVVVDGTPLLDEADAPLAVALGDEHAGTRVAALLVESPGGFLPPVLVLYEPARGATTSELALTDGLGPALLGNPRV